MASRTAKRRSSAGADPIDLTSNSPSKEKATSNKRSNMGAAASTSASSPTRVGRPRVYSSPKAKSSVGATHAGSDDDDDFDFTFDESGSDDTFSPVKTSGSGKKRGTKKKLTKTTIDPAARKNNSSAQKSSLLSSPSSATKKGAGNAAAAAASKISEADPATKKATVSTSNRASTASEQDRGSGADPPGRRAATSGANNKPTATASGNGGSGAAVADGDHATPSSEVKNTTVGSSGKVTVNSENGETNETPQATEKLSSATATAKPSLAAETTPPKSRAPAATAMSTGTGSAVKASAIRTPQGSSVGVGPASASKRAKMAPKIPAERKFPAEPKSTPSNEKEKDADTTGASAETATAARTAASVVVMDESDNGESKRDVKTSGSGSGCDDKEGSAVSSARKRSETSGASAAEVEESWRGRQRPSRAVAKKSYAEDSDTGSGASEKDRMDGESDRDDESGSDTDKRTGKSSSKGRNTAKGGSKALAANGSGGKTTAAAASSTARRQRANKKKAVDDIVDIDDEDGGEEPEMGTPQKGRKAAASGKGKGKARANFKKQDNYDSDKDGSPPVKKKHGFSRASSGVKGGGSAEDALALGSDGDDDMGVLENDEGKGDSDGEDLSLSALVEKKRRDEGGTTGSADGVGGSGGGGHRRNGSSNTGRRGGGAVVGRSAKKKKQSPVLSEEESTSELDYLDADSDNEDNDSEDHTGVSDSEDSYTPTAKKTTSRKKKQAASTASAASKPRTSAKKRRKESAGEGARRTGAGETDEPSSSGSSLSDKSKGKRKARATDRGSGALPSAKPTKLADDEKAVLKKLRRLRDGMEGGSSRSGAAGGGRDGAERALTLHELGLGSDVTEVREMGAAGVMDEIERIAVEVAQSIMDGKGFSFRVPTRSSGNQKYVEELDRIVLGDKVSYRNFVSTAMARKTAITTRVVQLVHQVLGKGIHITKRDMFYTDVKLFKEQADSDAVLDDVACMVGCTRSCLNVVASDKGLVVGRVSFLEDGDLIDCTRMGVGGKAIPPYIDKIADIKSDADFILLVEKEAAYMRMAEDRFYQKYPCIVITAKGQPDVATRLFLKRLKRELNIPVMGLVDSDPYGLKILSVYMSGSKNMSYDSASLTTPDIKWLGVRPSDLDRYNIPEQCRLDMTEHDVKTGKELMQEDFIKKNAAWYNELELMIKTRKKAEIQSLSAFGFQYLTETYLPQKLQNGDWL